jgi:hypothetical protein
VRTRPAYTECKIYYDGAQPIEIGHFLKTPAGSAYRIQNMRQDRRREYRRHLTCLRWPVTEIPADATVHPLHWYPRKKKRATTLHQFATRTA